MTHRIHALLRLGAAMASVLALVVMLLPATASATGTLDQSQPDTSADFAYVTGPTSPSSNSAAQTFTAGLSGMLDHVDLYLRSLVGRSNTPLIVEIRDVDATGTPGTTVLASSELAGVEDPAWYSVPFASAASVTAGTQYAIVVYTGTNSEYGWGVSDSINPYSAGVYFHTLSSPPSAWTELYDFDLAFNTYVRDPAADLSLTMVGPDETARRATATYILTVHNMGPDTAVHTVLTDKLPFGAYLTAITTSRGSCTPVSRSVTTVSCDLGDIANGDESNSAVTVRIQVRANANINFVANVASDTPDPNPDNNNASFSTWAGSSSTPSPNGGGGPWRNFCRPYGAFGFGCS